MPNLHIQKLLTVAKGFIELIFWSFIWFTVAIYSLDGIGIWLWAVVLLLGYILPMFLAKSEKTISNSLRAAISLGFMLLSLVIYSLTSYSGIIYAALISIITVLFIQQGFRQAILGWEVSFNNIIITFCTIGHLLLQILKVFWLNKIYDLSFWFNAFGIISVLLALFIFNERMLNEKQKILGKSRVFLQALQFNRIILGVISLTVFVIVLIREWREQLEAWIMQIIRDFLAWLTRERAREDSAPEELPAQLPMDFGTGDEPVEANAFLKWLELIVTYIVIGALAIFAIVLLYYLAKLAIKGIKQLLHRLTGKSALLDEKDVFYIDEIEEIEKTSRTHRSSSRFKRAKEKQWEELNAKEKARYLYRKAIKQYEKRGFNLLSSKSASENLAKLAQLAHENILSKEELELLNSLYNTARYNTKVSDEELSLEQLEAIYQSLKSTSLK